MPAKDIFDEMIECLKKEAEASPLTYVSPDILRDFNTDFRKKAQPVQPARQQPRQEWSSAPRRQEQSPATEEPAGPPTASDAEIAAMGWDALKADALSCRKCRLHSTRSNVVWSDGSPSSGLMFIGEGPGSDEDEQGVPFVGKAGQLLTRMIEAMQFKRPEVYIANIVKCRPPGNRNPEPDEAQRCLPYLLRQIELAKPRVVVLLGAVPLLHLLGLKGITRLRGVWHEYKGAKVMPTYHPAYLLRTPAAKKEVWEDLQKVMAEFGKKPAPKT